MLPGFSGNLVSEYFAEELLAASFAGELGEATCEKGRRLLAGWWKGSGSRMGPALSIRAVVDLGAVPVFEALGYEASHPRPSRHETAVSVDLAALGSRVPLVVTAWGEALDHVWSEVAREAVRLGAPWVFSFNGRELRLSDCGRLHARRHVAFDLATSPDHPAVFAVLWSLLRPSALVPPAVVPGPAPAPCQSLLDRIVTDSARHAVRVCASLRAGVRESLTHLLNGLVPPDRGRRQDSISPDRLWWTYDQALTLVYRVLFLLFAEARGLVPMWHPIYRDGYTVTSLCEQAEKPGRAAGLWEALQAISRLAHAGCVAGDLRVTPFNGRLFAPGRTPLVEARRIDDEQIRRAVLAVATQPGRSGRQRVAFRDLGVEQLGSVYESVLDFEPSLEEAPAAPSGAARGRARTVRVGLVGRGDRRKASGTFYTPRSITEYLVRRTLRPLVDGAGSGAILGLRVLDPAMGSGAFLVAACRYLASAYEAAMVREGIFSSSEVTDVDRAGFRRLVAERCLFGVDLNPMAVQVARLSIWLTTLAAERPLTFLDHHLAVGDSLVGASLDDLVRRPASRRGRAGPDTTLPFFDNSIVGSALQSVLPIRRRLSEPDDNVSVVREKERLLANIEAVDPVLARWRAAADLWCARWFPDVDDKSAPSAQEVGDLISRLVGRASGLPDHVARPHLDRARLVAEQRRFFHWSLEFPEVFFDAKGEPRADGGFDAVIGNPPWDMIRGDTGDAAGRSETARLARQLTRFARESGVYSAVGHGHRNRYQLFVERSLRIVRRGGMVGLVVPWGLMSDHGCEGLRGMLLERCRTDAIVSFDNTDGIFPIHRGLRFALLTASPGSPTRRVPCLFGARNPAVLETIPDLREASEEGPFPLSLSLDLIRRVSGPALVVPHVRDRLDLAILERTTASYPALADDHPGWGARFGRELNATDDRSLFLTRGPLPVVEGKHVEPFLVHIDRCARFLAGVRCLRSARLRHSVRRPRLAYRDVAASGNRLTLIAAIVPAGAITVHTLFCLNTPLGQDDQAFVCGVLNSFVANFLARLRVTTHLGVAGVERLPVPRPSLASTAYRRIVALAGTLAGTGEADADAYVTLQAEVARLYELSDDQFQHVLESFPLVSQGLRNRALAAFSALSGNG